MHVYSPDIVNDRSSRGYAPAFICVFLHRGMRYTEDDCGHPANSFLDATSYIWHLLVVLDCRETIKSDYLVNLCLDLPLNVRPEDTSQNEAIEDGCCGV